MINKQATNTIEQAGIAHLEILELNICLEATNDYPEFICKAAPIDTRVVYSQRTRCFTSLEKCVEAVLEGYRPTVAEKEKKWLGVW